MVGQRHLGGEKERGENDRPPGPRMQQDPLGARLQPVHVYERDDEGLGGEPCLMPDILYKSDYGLDLWGRECSGFRWWRRQPRELIERRAAQELDMEEWKGESKLLFHLWLRVCVLQEEGQRCLRVYALVVSNPPV